MPIELRSMETDQADLKLKLALVGAEQNGKSRLAATARAPILFHDFDNKRESLRGIPGVYAITYVDPQWPKQPDAAQLFLDIIGQLEESLDLSVLNDKFKLGLDVPKGTMIKTNVIDSIGTCGKAHANYALFNSPHLRRELIIGKAKVFFQGNWDAWEAEAKSVENNILRFLALPSDTIIILHETAEETDDSTPEKKKFTGRIDVYPARYRRLLKYFPEIWRVKLTQVVENNKATFVPRVYPLPNLEFDCGTTMHLDAVENPNIKAMLEKHQKSLVTTPKLPPGVKI